MIHSTSLARLLFSFRWRIRRLRSQCYRVRPNNLDQSGKILVAFACVETQNAWSNFVRAFYLSCIFEAKTATSKRVRHGVVAPDLNAGIGIAVQMVRPYSQPKSNGSWDRRDEPAWHDPNTLLRLSSRISCSHDSELQAAFSMGFTVFRDLPVFRNFFAHRNAATADAAANIASSYGIPSSLSAPAILLSAPYGRFQPLLFEWMDELLFTAEYMCD